MIRVFTTVRTVVMCAVMILAARTAAQAELLEFNITGVILEEDYSDPDGQFQDARPGDPFSALLRYDSELSEIAGGIDPNFGTFFPEAPFVTFSMTLGSSTFTTMPETPTDIFIVNNVEDPSFGLIDQVNVFAESAVAPENYRGTPVELGVVLISTNLDVLPDPSLPTSYDAEQWDARIAFFAADAPDGGRVNINGGIESIVLQGDDLPALRAGDADLDLDFDQLDLVQVQVAAKYLSGTPATWGEGDWDGPPGTQANPGTGNGLFDQIDIVSALRAGVYLTGPYAAVSPSGVENDGQASLGYAPSTGEIWVDAPSGIELTSVNIDSASGIFTGDSAASLGGSFDNDTDANIFKATFGGSFGSLSFGNVAQTGLSEDFLVSDLTVVGSLAGGGDLGPVDLIYVPEPSAAMLLVVALGILVTVTSPARRLVRVLSLESEI